MHSFNLRPEGESARATAVVQLMDQGDLLIGVREIGAHPDSEYAIVTVAVDDLGALTISVMDGDGCTLAEAITVQHNPA